MTANRTDAMLTRLETEIEERSSFINQIVGGAQDAGRDLLDSEQELLRTAKKRIEECDTQLTTLSETRSASTIARRRVQDVDAEYATLAKVTANGAVEYRTAGSYIVDTLGSYMGDRESRERLDVYNRTAAHQITTDNPGLLPTPILGDVINFIDAARPLVNALGVQPLTTSPFRRPKITQQPAVGLQGTNGVAADEKTELDSQKMTITSTTINALTYGGYVNVSRQNIDWSSPQVFDIIVNGLAQAYAIATESAACDAVQAVGTSAVSYPLNPTADEANTAIWTAAATVYSAAKGIGSTMLLLAPDRLAAFGQLFAPYGPSNQFGQGFNAGQFGQGVMGTIAGIPVVVSSGLASGDAFLMSTAALEIWEQRIGTLSVVEPSVLGVQVAYAGYFATFTANAGAIVPLDEATV